MEVLYKADRQNDLDDFLAGMTEEQRRMIRTDRKLRDLRMADPVKFLELITSNTITSELLFKFSALEAAFSRVILIFFLQ